MRMRGDRSTPCRCFCHHPPAAAAAAADAEMLDLLQVGGARPAEFQAEARCSNVFHLGAEGADVPVLDDGRRPGGGGRGGRDGAPRAGTGPGGRAGGDRGKSFIKKKTDQRPV